MEHKITFYPIGNADTTLIELSNNQKVLIDYANMRCKDDLQDKRTDLPTELNKVVSGNYDVVCFTHADNDHICGFTNYFYLEHSATYQTAGRKKISELWVPAQVLTETNLSGECLTLRTEARYRLKNKKGIKIFSRPKKLREWCDKQTDISFSDIEHLIVDAGTLAPGFTLSGQGVEFFVHSPFFSEEENVDRNSAAIVMQATFNDSCQTKVILGSDIDHEVWSDIVKVTRHFGNDHRLAWDIFHISHHCSYTALGSDKGVDETVPNDNVKWLFETMGSQRSWLISPSWSILITDEIQPPHKQAAAYYRRIKNLKQGEFKVTMDHPKQSNPEPLTYIIDSLSCTRLFVKASSVITHPQENRSSRAGHGE
jgi:hypothetical protein